MILKVIFFGEINIYWLKDVVFVVNYFWVIIFEFVSGIYKYIFNELVIEDFYSLNKNLIWENRYLELCLVSKVVD